MQKQLVTAAVLAAAVAACDLMAPSHVRDARDRLVLAHIEKWGYGVRCPIKRIDGRWFVACFRTGQKNLILPYWVQENRVIAATGKARQYMVPSGTAVAYETKLPFDPSEIIAAYR